jgi:protein tyrosine phosphatase
MDEKNCPAFLKSIFVASDTLPRSYLRRQFEELEAYSSTLPGLPHDVFQRYTAPPLAFKNRYRLVLPLSDARVKLRNIDGCLIEENQNDYINANYVGHDKRYIATQAPLPRSIPDFWRMVWGEGALCIVMLVRVHPHKADCYWPASKGRSFNFTGLTVTLQTCEYVAEGLCKREFLLKCGEESRLVIQFHFENWPDHGPPTSFKEFYSIHSLISSHSSFLSRPVIIHCRYINGH